VRTISELALVNQPSLDKYREALTEGLECADEILTLVDTLMDIAETESGAYKLRLQTFALKNVIDEVFDLYELTAEAKDIRLSAVCPLELSVTADRGLMKRMISNLIDNAIKFSNRGNRVDVHATDATQVVEISVCDSGIGIAPDDMNRIWDRHYRANPGSSKGMGLGLSVVKSAANAHGGSVRVQSEVAKARPSQ
jgi:signal transduction histidine kinase